MALWLVLKDFNGAIVSGGSEWTPAGVILDDLLTNVVALQAAGCPMVPWTASPAQVSARNAFLSRSPTPGQPLASENLLDLLATFGAFGGGGGGGASFTFRPTAVDDPSVNLYGSWASLLAATAVLAAAGVAFVITIDFSLVGASFLIPTSANFGGQAILRSTSPFLGVTLQVAFPNTLAGIAQITDFLIVEAVGAAPSPALILSPNAILILSRGAKLMSSNPNAPLIAVGAGEFCVIPLLFGSTIGFGGSSAIDVALGGTLTVPILEVSQVENDSISGSGTLSLEKSALSASLPTSLVAFVGYLAGGIGSSVVFGVSYSILHATFGARTIPLAAGVYFLPYNGSAAVPIATVVDQPFREVPSLRPRLLNGASIWSAVDAAVAGGIDVDVLLNGVPVPGMSVAGLNVSTMTAPYQLQATNPVLLQFTDSVSVRVTVPGGGIVATPTDVFCAIEVV